MFKKLRTALFATFIGITISSLLITFLLTIRSVNNMVLEQTHAQIIKQLDLASEDFTSLIMGGAEQRKIQGLAVKTSNAIDSRVTVIDGKGKVLADSDMTLSGVGTLENHYYRPEIREAAIAGIGSVIRYSSTLKKDYIYVAKALKRGNSIPIAFIRFSVPKTYAYEQDLNMLKPFLAAAILSIIISILMSMFFSASFAKPIIKLAEIAKQITKGKFPQYIHKYSKFELGELEEALDGMSRDMSHTFNKLNMEKHRIDAILSSMTEGVIAVDDNGDVMAVNESAKKMFSIKEDITGKNAIENIRNSIIVDMIKGRSDEGTYGEKEIKAYTPDEKTLLVQAARIKTGGMVVVLHDISNMKRLEKMRSEFAANVSHELKTPLTSIKAATETLLSGAMKDKDHGEAFLKKIHNNADRLSLLIDDVMELSELETSKAPRAMDILDIDILITKAEEELSQKISSKKIVIKRELHKPPLKVVCSSEHLSRVLINLLDNAIKYNKEKGAIFISSADEGDSVRINIKDTGIGIEEAYLPRIFERFYTVDRSRSRELGGTGLGLAIVKHVIELYGGEIKVSSKPGEGSVFSFTLKKA